MSAGKEAENESSSSNQTENSSNNSSPSCNSGSSSGITKLSLTDDNTSFFSSQNSFQKIVPEPRTENEEEEQQDPSTLGNNTQILNDSLPDINSTEDWEAAFGFSKQQQMQQRSSAQQSLAQSIVKDSLDAFGMNFGNLGSNQVNKRICTFFKFSVFNIIFICFYFTVDQSFNKLDTFSSATSNYIPHMNGFDIKDSLLEVITKNGNNSQFPTNHQLSSFKAHTSLLEDRLNPYGIITHHQNHLKEINGGNGLNGLNGMDHMSKFISDFYKNGQKDLLFNGSALPGQNGLTHQPPNGLSNGLTHQNIGYMSPTDKQALFLLQQRQIEEQLMNLNLKQSSGSNTGQYLNGDIMNGAQQNQSFVSGLHLFQNGPLLGGTQKNLRHQEDELDFDPFQETQKGLAELIENEQNIKLHGIRSGLSGQNQINGLLHSQNNGSHLPPPPPGFVQPNTTHMNSFGKPKIYSKTILLICYCLH